MHNLILAPTGIRWKTKISTLAPYAFYLLHHGLHICQLQTSKLQKILGPLLAVAPMTLRVALGDNIQGACDFTPPPASTNFSNPPFLGLIVKCYIARFTHLRSRSTIQKEINLAIILMFIVIVFLFCNIPRILINCYDFMVNNDFVR